MLPNSFFLSSWLPRPPFPTPFPFTFGTFPGPSSNSKRMSFGPAFPAVFLLHALLLRHCCCVYCLSVCRSVYVSLCCMCICLCMPGLGSLKTKSPSFPGHLAGCAVAISFLVVLFIAFAFAFAAHLCCGSCCSCCCLRRIST